MKYIVIYLLLLASGLAPLCRCGSEDGVAYTNLTLNHTFTHQLSTQEEYFTATLSQDDISFFDVLLLETAPFNHNNPAHIYVSQRTSVPSHANYTACSNSIGTNRLYIYAKDIDHSVPLYVHIKCTYNCVYNITATFTNKLTLQSHADEIHYTPRHGKTFFYYAPTNASVDITMYVIGDRDSNFIAEFTVYNATSNEIIADVACMNVYYAGCGNIIPITSLVTPDMNIHDVYIEAGVSTELSGDDEPQGVRVGVYVEDVTKYIQPLQRIHGIIDNNYITRMCFDVQEFQQWPPTKLLFYYELYTHGVKVEFITQPGEEVFYSETILNNNYTLFNSSLFTNSYFCLTTPDHFDKDDILVSFVFTFTYTSETEFVNAQTYLPTLVSGVFYHLAIPKDRVAFFRRKNAHSSPSSLNVSTVNANVIKLKENVEMYPYVCTSFPYCAVTTSMIPQIRSASTDISSIYTIQNQISIEYNTSALSHYEHEQIVFVLYCNASLIEDADTHGCEFLLEIDNSASIELLPNVNFIERHRQRHDGFTFRFSGTYSIASLSLMVDNMIGYGALTGGSVLYTVMSNRNVVVYQFKGVESKRLHFAAPPYGEEDSVYTLKVVVDGFRMNVVKADYLGSVLVGVADGEVAVDVEFGSLDVKYSQRGRYLIDVVSANCFGNVRFDNASYSNVKDVEIVYDDREGDHYVTNGVVYLQAVSMNSGFNSEKEKCAFHIGVVNEYNVNGLQLKENEQFTFHINKDIPQRTFNYIISLPHNATSTSVQLSLDIKHTNKELTPPIPLALQVSTNTVDNVQKTFLIFNTTTLMLSSPLLSSCSSTNTNTHLCQLYLTVSANYTSTAPTPSAMVISLLLTHQTPLPMFIEKQTVHKLSQPSKKQAMYLYTTLTSAEYGEAIFSFNTQPEVYGGVFAADEQYGYGWMGNIPLDKNNINKIPFNSYTQSLKWGKDDLLGCDNGCYLILMLCLNDDNERYSYVNEFTVEINTVDPSSGMYPHPKAMLNEVIERVIEKDGDVVYYYFTVDEDAERLVITLSGLNAVMYIKQALNTTPSETNYDWKLNATESASLDITSEQHEHTTNISTLRGNSFTLAIVLSTYVQGSSKVSFQITPRYETSPIADYFSLSYSDHGQCVLSSGKNTCNFIVHIPYGYGVSFFGTYAESRSHPSTLIETYASVYSTSHIQSNVYVNGDDMFNYFPRDNRFDHKSTPDSNALEIFTSETARDDVYVFISLTTINQVDDVIDFYTSNISPLNKAKLTHGGKRLLYYDNKGIGEYEWNVLQYANATSAEVKGIVMEMRVVKGNAVISKRDDDKNTRKYVLNSDSAMLVMGELGDEDGKEKQVLRIENDVYNEHNSKMILGSYSYNVVNRVEMVNVNVASLFYFEERGYPLHLYSKVNCNSNCNISMQLNFMWNRNITELNGTIALSKFPFEINVYNVDYAFISRRLSDSTIVPLASEKMTYDELLQSIDVYFMNIHSNEAGVEYVYIEITKVNGDSADMYARSELNVLISKHSENAITFVSQGKYYYSLYDVSNRSSDSTKLHSFAFTPFYDSKQTRNELFVEINESLLPHYKHLPPLLTYTLTEYGNYSNHIDMLKLADTNGVNVYKANIISNTTYKVVLHVQNKHNDININDSRLLYSVKFYTKQIVNDNETVNAPNVRITRSVDLHYNEHNEKVIAFKPVSIAEDSIAVYKPIIYKLQLFTKNEVNVEQFTTAIVKDVNGKVLPKYEIEIQSGDDGNDNNNNTEIKHVVNGVSGKWDDYDTCLLAYVKGDFGMESVLNYMEPNKGNETGKIALIVVCIVLIVMCGVVLVGCVMKKRRGGADELEVFEGKLLDSETFVD